ncbi:hypothetical protein KBD81_01395 [Candidatus Woesebacteria bacterium]|nr:hypothetical protein [Candidatus Woesebacteria bacterium]
MKKFMKQIIFDISLWISQTFELEHWIMGSNSLKYHFFLDWGPKILIVRENAVFLLGSAFEIECKFNDKKELLSVLPIFMTAEPGDLVFYGKQKVYEEYEKYSRPQVNMVGMTS